MSRAPLLSLFVAGFALATHPLPGAVPIVVQTEFVFEKNPVPSCHASTLVEAADGSLVAGWFAGSGEGKPDVGIWVSRQTGGKWTQPEEVADGVQPDGTRYPCWNPVLFQPKGAELLLFYKVGPSPVRWWGMLRRSNDHGKSWGTPERLPASFLGPVKNKPVQLPDGSLLCGSSEEGLKPPPSWQIHFERTKDLGRTWERITVPQDGQSPASIQPSILFLGADRLMSLGRTQAGKLFNTRSEDAGRTWSAPSLLDLPNPNSGTDAVTLQSGVHLLVYNHCVKGRSPLNVAVSRDGSNWEAAVTLESEPGGEFSYPAVIQTGDGFVHVTYTWKRKLLKHAVLDPSRVRGLPINGGVWPVAD
jgi:predicted neuraminidase